MSSLRQVIDGTVAAFCLHHPRDSPRTGLVLFPGSFNPLHAGHLEMARVAERLLARPVHFELSIVNVDKDVLDEAQCRTRTAQFTRRRPVWVTRAATFGEKARLFPGATFVVGTDTILRVVDSAYHHDDESQRDNAIRYLANAGSRFLVFGRQVGPHFRVLSNLALPQTLSELCQEVPEGDFRLDVSSTDLRS